MFMRTLLAVLLTGSMAVAEVILDEMQHQWVDLPLLPHQKESQRQRVLVVSYADSGWKYVTMAPNVSIKGFGAPSLKPHYLSSAVTAGGEGYLLLRESRNIRLITFNGPQLFQQSVQTLAKSDEQWEVGAARFEVREGAIYVIVEYGGRGRERRSMVKTEEIKIAR